MIKKGIRQMAEATATKTKEEDQTKEGSEVEVSEAELSEATDSGDTSGGGQIDILLDTTVAVTAQLGEAQLEVRDLLQLGPGSVVQLSKKAGEPVDLHLRNVKFATGSLVVVGDQLGVRIKEIIASAGQAAQ
jgi:flagellar motor switch protein FliN/FliY